MRVLSVFKKEILQNLRDKKSMFMMVVFPILMILILGTAFSESFSSYSSSMTKVKILYSLNKDANVCQNFKQFIKDIEKEMNLEAKEITDQEKAKELIKDGKYDSYIQVKSDKEILISTNNIRVFNSSLVENLVDTFVQRANVIKKVVEVNPKGMVNLKESKKPNYINVKTIAANEGPRAIDYYTVTMFTMIILYSTATGTMSILSEKRRKTMERMCCSSISKMNILLGKVLGCLSITIFQAAMVFLFTKYAIKSNWGSHVDIVLLISFSLILMSVSVGVGVASFIKNENIMAVAINTIIPVFVFLGGGYIPLELFGSKFLNNLSKISPIKWTNDAIFKIVYGKDFSYVGKAIALNLIIAFIFILIPVVASRKEVA